MATTKTKQRSIKKEASTKPELQSGLRRFPLQVWIIGAVVLILLALYLARSLFIVAVVNGKPIWRHSVVGQLESEGGKRVLEQLVTTSLIFQEASEQGIKVTDKEVNERIKKIEDSLTKQGQNLDSVLALQKTTREKLVEQITLQVLVEKILGKDIAVTDKEIAEYREKNKELLVQDASEDIVYTQVKEQLQQQKLSEKFQRWITALQKKAKIFYVLQY